MSPTRFNGFMSGAQQFGRWVPEKEMYARGVMGGATIDFSHALFRESVITVHARAFWGGVTIIVPPNVVVEQNGRAIMGGFGGSGGLYYSTGKRSAVSSVPNSGIIVKLSGTSIMGGVSAIVNKKAEPAQIVTRVEAERILREAPPVPSTGHLDIAQQVLGDVFGGLASRQEVLGVPVNAACGVAQGVQADDQHRPTLLATKQHDDGQVNALKPSVPSSHAVAPLDMKKELKELKVLMDDGILTQEEFDVQKKRVLMQGR